MNARQQKIIARFGQVLTFLDANTNTIPPAKVANQRQALSAAIAEISGFAQDQVVKGQESLLAQTLSSARIALRDTYMRQLSTVGLLHLTGKHAGDPAVANGRQIFTLPVTRTNALTLINAAKAMVAAATPYASIFTAASVNLDAVTGAIQAVENAVNASQTAKRISKGATQGIKAQIRIGQGAVGLMDVVVRPLLAGNKSLLTQWESVKRAAGGQNLATPVPVPAVLQAPAAQPASTPAGTSAGTSAGTPSPAATQPATPQPAASAPAAPGK